MKNQNNICIPEIVKSLWLDGFFVESKSLGEVSAKFSEMGYHILSSTLSKALTRMITRGSILSRVKKSQKWKYVQKLPASSPVDKRKKLFFRYDLHPRIKVVALQQFQDGHFKEAIQNALVEVIDQVKIQTGYPKNGNGRELDGDDLMNQVFGCDSHEPLVKFNDLATSLDKAEQRGMMNLFKGIVGIRDRKAHLNFIQNDPLKTIEYLSLASLLLRLIDESNHSLAEST
jgi:uncharacterized protein (TIGR02391 family)